MLLHERNQTRVAKSLSCPISRARCRRGRRSSCSTSALLDTDRRGSSTRHTWGFPWEGRSDPASLRRQKHTQCQHTRVITQTGGGYCSYLTCVLVQCKRVHIHCGSTSHHRGNRCHWSKIQHTVLNPRSCEDTLLAWLKEKQKLTHTKRIKTGIYKTLSMLDSQSSVQSLRRFNQRFNSKKKFNIVARTESRRDTDSSTVKDTAFVVSGTVFITRTPLMWWDNIKETWQWPGLGRVAERKRQWSRRGDGISCGNWLPNNLVVEWNSQTCTFFSTDYTLKHVKPSE